MVEPTTGTDAASLLSPGDAQLRDAVRAWLDGLARERRMAANTVEAYGRDLRQFLVHVAARHGTPTIAGLTALKVRDVRAFMAARRAEAISGRSLMRMLAGLRSFARYLERPGLHVQAADRRQSLGGTQLGAIYCMLQHLDCCIENLGGHRERMSVLSAMREGKTRRVRESRGGSV